MAWRVPKIWENEDAWILGGGPSIPHQFGVPQDIIDKVKEGKLPPSSYSPYLHPIHDRNVIGVNAAYNLGSWIKVLFFGDKGFFLKHKRDIRKFPNLKITCANTGKNWEYQKTQVKFLSRESRRHGICDSPEKICWNFNSGAAAINVAVHFGVTRIFLLGFDMKESDKTGSHWHNVYNNKSIKDVTFNRHLKSFPYIEKDTKKRGIEIINLNPDSAIKCFKKANLDEVI